MSAVVKPVKRNQRLTVDQQIGERIRDRRRAAGLSQEKLGVALGVTFQQVQKFENGKNRIAASQLLVVANRLGLPVGGFFPDPL